jgi:hypothetical protein
MDPNCLVNKKRNLMRGSVAVAVLAIAFSADAYLPDTVPPIFAGQAFAANINSDGNGRSGGDNGRSGDNGNGGRSADAQSRSRNESARGRPASIRGIGRGLLRLLTTGSAWPSSAGNTPAGVATGPPMQLLPSQANGAATGAALVRLPAPRPVEWNLEVGADVQAAVTANDAATSANDNVIPTYQDNLNAAVAVIEADSSFDATVDAYKALAAIIAAFEEADKRADEE